jgi:two-component system OmpR family sensor kinase
MKNIKIHKDIYFKSKTILKVINRFDEVSVRAYLQHQDLSIVTLNKDIIKDGELVKPTFKLEKNYRDREEHGEHRDYSHYTSDRDYTYNINSNKVSAILHCGDLYYYVSTCKGELFLKDNRFDGDDKLNYFNYIYISIFALVIFMYIMLLKSLNPLKKLTSEIKKFGEGKLDIDTKSTKKDEIAVLANEFDNAVQNIKSLKSAKELFLRNIMHELKTPITKGKLSVSLLEDETNAKILNSVFDRLDTLINEMADITRVSSDVDKVDTKEYRVLDILDNAIDLLYLDKSQVIHNVSSELITGDFKLLTMLFKNLIDNAIKYSDTSIVEVSIKDNQILFINDGKELENYEDLLEPFHKGQHTKSNQKGFGLGLYIINQIVKRHEFDLEYRYDNNKNIFTISFV